MTQNFYTMKKIITCVTLITITLISTVFAQDQKVIPCATHEYMQNVQMKDPQFIINQQILEQEYENYLLNGQKSGQKVKRVIPIVFHIFHNNGVENIPKERILEQVDILNKDFQRLNPDTNETNPLYKAIAANCEIEFRLAKLDPNGNCTDGIVRVQTDLTYDADDNIKALSRWPNNKYFNVWVVESISGAPAGSVILGRSQFPGGSNLTDGVLLKHSVCGNTPSFNNYGRTLTHEIGHSLNLRHIWGDGTCATDFVNDTPPHSAANDGCPKNKVSTCAGNAIEMTENYMDYTDGNCQNMFSLGQKTRMDVVWNGSQNSRSNLYSAANLIATGTNDGYNAPPCVPLANFYRRQEGCTNTNYTFSDFSTRADVVNYFWEFEGGSPATSTDKNPTVSYANAGTYDVKLKVSNATGADSITKQNFMKIWDNVSTRNLPFSQDMEDENSFANDIYNRADNKSQWLRTTAAGFNSSSSVYMKFFGVSDGRASAILLPTINLVGTTNPILSYDYAYAQRSSASLDRLTIGITRNCGLSFNTLSNVTGASLATRAISSTEFVPNSPSQWKRVETSLSSYTNEDNAQIRFLATNSGPGNNIYIDNITISVATGIENLILNNLNLSVAPNPFNKETKASFNLLFKANVQVELYDLLGRKLTTVYNGNLSSGMQEVRIDETHTQQLTSGIYLLKLTIDGVSKTERIALN
jgi:PKD repeat protein